MNKFNKMTIRLMAIAQIFAISLLAACSSVGIPPLSAAADITTLSKICHSTGDPANPYEETTVTSTELNDHLGHPDDIIPAFASGCPASTDVFSDGKITICHATDSATNPYEEITVSVNGLNGHSKHEGDIFPLSDGTCPKNVVVTATDNKDKITICHATNSQKNPYNEITISVNGLNGHNQHADDIIPAPAGGCPRTGDESGGNNGNGNGHGNNGNGNGGGDNGKDNGKSDGKNGNGNGGGSNTP